MSDYIKREDVVEKLVRTFLLQAPTARAIVENIPAADVAERKTAKWSRENLVATVGGTYSVVRCSECKAQFPFWETNYCPNCGADMRKK